MVDLDRADQHNFDEAFARADIGICAAVFQQRFARAPEDVLTKALAMRLHAVTADPSGGRTALKGLVEDNPDRPELRAYLAHLLSLSGESDEALEHARGALEAAPESFECTFALGVSQLSTGDAAGAIEALEKASALDDTSSAARFYLGKAREAAGDGAGAETAYAAATTIVPGFIAAWQGRARLCAVDGRFDDAVKLLDEALAANAGDATLTQLREQAAAAAAGESTEG
jgi:Flp pilus assembly protein TadD